MPSIDDGFDDRRTKEREVQRRADEAVGHTFALGDFLDGTGTTGGEFLEPDVRPGDGFQERRVRCPSVGSGIVDDQLRLDAAPGETDRRFDDDELIAAIRGRDLVTDKARDKRSSL